MASLWGTVGVVRPEGGGHGVAIVLPGVCREIGCVDIEKASNDDLVVPLSLDPVGKVERWISEFVTSSIPTSFCFSFSTLSCVRQQGIAW